MNASVALSTPALVSKLPKVGTTIFTVMSALATEHKAVNLGQGFPDFHCDPALVDAVAGAMREGLSEEELAIVDILTKPEPALNAAEHDLVKQVARSLLETLKREKLVLDWRLKERAKAAVRSAIQQSLDALPPAYDDAVWQAKAAKTYEWVFEHYQ
jgi:HrpA-like RNA helicase